jgi:hypothetical protein
MGTLRVRKLAVTVGLGFAWLALLLLHTWATLAIYFTNFHQPVARILLPLVYVLFLVALVIFVRRQLLRLIVVTVIFVLAAGWWISIQPIGRGEYLPPVARLAYPEFHGDLVTIRNLRNFDYRARDDYDIRYEDRTYISAN